MPATLLSQPEHDQRLLVFGGKLEWRRALIARALRQHMVPELVPWDLGKRLRPPVCGVVANVPSRDVMTVLQYWAGCGLQPICVVSLEPFLGASDVKCRLQELGYSSFVHARPLARENGRYWNALDDQLARLALGRLALVPIIGETLRLVDADFLQLMSAALDPRVACTVQRWSAQAGITPGQLAAVLRRLELPLPKRTLSLIRLGMAVSIAASGASRDEVAASTGFSSGDYLGKRCHRITGHAFGELVTEGPTRVFKLLTAS